MEMRELSQKAEAIRRQLAANDKASNSSRTFLQCFCTHRDDNGEYILDVPDGGKRKSPHTGAPYYRCKRCGVELDLSAVSNEDLEKAKDTINRLLHMSKMAMNLNTPDDKKLMEKVMKLQLRFNNIVPGLARTLGKGRKRNNNRRGSNSVIEVGRR